VITHKNLHVHFLSEIEISDNDKYLFTNGILFEENIKVIGCLVPAGTVFYV